MGKKAFYVILVIVIIAIVLLLINIYRPEWFSQLWLWVIGLFGGVVAGFKKLFSFGDGKSLNNISTENEEIKKRMSEIEVEVKQAQERLERERSLHAREVAVLEKQIALKEVSIKQYQNAIKDVNNMSDDEILEITTQEKIDRLMGPGIPLE
jgi:cell shape-determining protein MreC